MNFARNFATSFKTKYESSKVSAFFRNYYIAHVFRAARVGVLGFVIYKAGYNSGILDFTRDPDEMEKKLTSGILAPMKADLIHPRHHPLSIRAENVGSRIVAAAQ